MKYIIYTFVALVLFSCNSVTTNKPKVHQGVLDAREWDFKTNKTLNFDGEWQFYWKKLYTPADIKTLGVQPDTLLTVPDSWNGNIVRGELLKGSGFATYRLLLLADSSVGKLALKINDQATAFKVYVNGILATQSGIVGDTDNKMSPSLMVKIVVFDAQPTNEIVIQISNFNHKKGGMWDTIDLGSPDAILSRHNASISMDAFLFGFLSLLVVFCLGLFVFRPTDKPSLFFALLNTFISLRVVVTGERLLPLFIEQVPYSVYHRIEYISWIWLPFLVLFFAMLLFPQVMNRKLILAWGLLPAIFSSIVLLCSGSQYTHIAVFVHIYVLISIVYGLISLVQSIRKGYKAAYFILAGTIILVITTVHDVMVAEEIFYNTYIASWGFVSFMIGQAFALSLHFLQVEKDKKDLESAVNTIQKLTDIGQKVTASLNLSEILEIVYQNVNKLMDASVFGLGLYNAKNQQIHYEIAIERDLRYKPYTRDMSDKNQFPVWCIENSKPVVINDIAKEYKNYINYWAGEKDKELEDGSKAQNPVSLIYLPLMANNNVLGVITVQSFKTNAYTAEHLKILENICVYAVIALENAKTVQHIAQQKEQLESTLTHLQHAQAELHEQREQISLAYSDLQEKNTELENTLHTLQTTQKKLVEAEKMASLGNLVAGVAHEINTPVGIAITSVSTVINEIKELVEKYEKNDMSASDFESYVQMFYDGNTLALKNLERTAGLVRSFKQISLDQHSEQERKFNLNDYLYDILASINPEFKLTQIKIDINCPPDLVINSYPGAFAQIFTNLLTNSKRHGFRNRNEGQINIVVKRENEKLNIEYTDNGHGINEKVLPRIFDPFFTTDMQGGTGLGLNILYNLVTQKLGGEIKCESREGEGVRFLMTL